MTTQAQQIRAPLPCPFCGGDSNAKPHSQHLPGCYFLVLAEFKVRAANADLSMTPELLASWNRRAPVEQANRAVPGPDNIREGAPYNDPEFQEIARSYDVWGKANSALCAEFFLAGQRAGGAPAAQVPDDVEPVTYWHLENEFPIRPSKYDPEEHQGYVPLYTATQVRAMLAHKESNPSQGSQTGIDGDGQWNIESASAGEIAAYDYAVASHCKAVLNILDGNDDGRGANIEPWATVRRRLCELVKASHVQIVSPGWQMVPVECPNEICCAIERTIDGQMAASGITALMHRMDGARVWEEALAAAPKPPAQAAEPVADGLPLVIAGAIYDFAGFLTTRQKVIEVGSTADASPVVDLIKEWAAKRNLSLKDAAVLSWQELLRAPQPARQPLTDEQIDAMVATASIAERDMFRRFARRVERAHGIKE